MDDTVFLWQWNINRGKSWGVCWCGGGGGKGERDQIFFNFRVKLSSYLCFNHATVSEKNKMKCAAHCKRQERLIVLGK